MLLEEQSGGGKRASMTTGPRATEMGYLLLEDCEIKIEGQGERLAPKNEWIDVRVGHQQQPLQNSSSGSSSNHNSTAARKRSEGASETREDANQSPRDLHGDGGDALCRRCNLVLRCCSGEHGSSSERQLDLDPQMYQHPFHGTVQDLLCSDCSDDGDDHRRAKRSDAALLFGLLVACRPQIHIVQCRVLLRESDDDDDDQQQRSALLFTLAFPHLLHYEDQNQQQQKQQTASVKGGGRRSILAAPVSRASRQRSTKLLHPALQLLLQLLRSDWKRLEVWQQQQQQQSKLRSFFPAKLTLGEIYAHIQGTNSSGSDRRTRALPNNEEDDGCCRLTSLPTELLAERVAPFFDAASLAAVRCCSSFLYQSLRHVVPGLKLKLYSHQIRSLSWMRRREASAIRSEADCFQTNNNGDLSLLDGDVHRSVTGGATVRLESKPSSVPTGSSNSDGIVVRLDTCTGHEIEPDGSLSRSVARGGLLCDDPGLGKTITVLALILQTRGLVGSSSTALESAEQPAKEPALDIAEAKDERRTDDDAIFHAYWSEQVVPDFRRPYLHKLLNEMCKRCRQANLLPLGTIKKAIDGQDYGGDFSAFETAVTNVIGRYAPDDEATRFLDTFRLLVAEFQQSQMRSARKCFSNAKAKPNSRVAALIEQETQRRHLESLIPSSATLIVVPSVLVEHWKTQIEQHVDLHYFTDKVPLIFEYGRKDSAMTVDKATILCELKRTHAPVVFLDLAGTRPLPPAEFMAKFDIVITTTQRFMQEWKNGSFQSELERNDSDDTPAYRDPYYFKTESDVPCELLKVHWLRMVVDEGHSMGNDQTNSTIQFASWVTAKNRWAMTGTPTKQSAAKIGQLRGLMRFLQHDFFTSRREGDVFWKRNIAKSWRDGHLVSFFRLRSLLGFLMKRHTKLDIAELPVPVYSKTVIPMSVSEATAYNTVVSGVQLNLLMTSMEGKTSGLQDSLLHRSQAASARLVLQNIRRVCSGFALRVVPSIQDRFYRETIYMAQEFQLSKEAIAGIRDFMYRAENEDLSPCAFCGLCLSTLVLMPCCGGQICTECMDSLPASAATSCLLCEKDFDVDELQKFQPGFVLNWKLDSVQAKPNDTSPPANQSPSSGAAGSNIENSAVVQLPAAAPAPDDGPLIRPPRERRKKKRFGDGHECEYDRYAADGQCIHCHHEHGSCNLLNALSRCKVCHRVAETCPENDSKSFYLISKLLDLYHTQPSSVRGERGRPLKVIVFSQFRAALNLIGHRLLRRLGNACVAEYFGRSRKQELHKFTYDPACFCLLLTKDGAEGLDLSFATHLFFFEEIFDKSLERQAVARAWRMGAKGRVYCETLLAGNSVEETMSAQSGNHEDDGETGRSGSTRDQQRLKSLLVSLRFITDHHHFAKVDESTKTIHGKEETNKSSAGRKRWLPISTLREESSMKRTKKVQFLL